MFPITIIKGTQDCRGALFQMAFLVLSVIAEVLILHKNFSSSENALALENDNRYAEGVNEGDAHFLRDGLNSFHNCRFLASCCFVYFDVAKLSVTPA